MWWKQDGDNRFCKMTHDVDIKSQNKCFPILLSIRMIECLCFRRFQIYQEHSCSPRDASGMVMINNHVSVQLSWGRRDVCLVLSLSLHLACNWERKRKSQSGTIYLCTQLWCMCAGECVCVHKRVGEAEGRKMEIFGCSYTQCDHPIPSQSCRNLTVALSVKLLSFEEGMRKLVRGNPRLNLWKQEIDFILRRLS